MCIPYPSNIDTNNFFIKGYPIPNSQQNYTLLLYYHITHYNYTPEKTKGGLICIDCNLSYN